MEEEAANAVPAQAQGSSQRVDEQAANAARFQRRIAEMQRMTAEVEEEADDLDHISDSDEGGGNRASRVNRPGREGRNHGRTRNEQAARAARITALANRVAEVADTSRTAMASTRLAVVSALQRVESGQIGVLGLVGCQSADMDLCTRVIVELMADECEGQVMRFDCTNSGQSHRREFSRNMRILQEGLRASADDDEDDDVDELVDLPEQFPRGIVVLTNLDKAALQARKRYLEGLRRSTIAGIEIARGVLVILVVEAPDSVHAIATERSEALGGFLVDDFNRQTLYGNAMLCTLGIAQPEYEDLRNILHGVILVQPSTLLSSGVRQTVRDLGFTDAVSDAIEIAGALSCLSSDQATALLRTLALTIGGVPTLADVEEAVEQQRSRRTNAEVAIAVAAVPREVQNLSRSGTAPNISHHQLGDSLPEGERYGEIEVFAGRSVPGVTLGRTFPPPAKCQFEVVVPGVGVGYCCNRSECNTHSEVDRRLGKVFRMTREERIQRVEGLQNLATEGNLRHGGTPVPFQLPIRTGDLNGTAAARVTHPAFLLLIVRWILACNVGGLRQLQHRCSTWRALVRHLPCLGVLDRLPEGLPLEQTGLPSYIEPDEFEQVVQRTVDRIKGNEISSELGLWRRIARYKKRRIWYTVSEQERRRRAHLQPARVEQFHANEPVPESNGLGLDRTHVESSAMLYSQSEPEIAGARCVSEAPALREAQDSETLIAGVHASTGHLLAGREAAHEEGAAGTASALGRTETSQLTAGPRGVEANMSAVASMQARAESGTQQPVGMGTDDDRTGQPETSAGAGAAPLHVTPANLRPQGAATATPGSLPSATASHGGGSRTNPAGVRNLTGAFAQVASPAAQSAVPATGDPFRGSA